jgi:hypothetical protein
MLDQLNSLQILARFDVVLTGDWVLSPSAQRNWSGEAIAETALVGIVFLSCGNRMYWAKSGAWYAKVAPQVYESQPVSSKLPMALFLHDTFNRNVQFMYSIGPRWNGIFHATAMLSKDYLPQIPPTRTVQTGQLFTFASIDSMPMTTLYAMFLAKQDVKMKRKHIWRLRKPLLERLTSPLLEVFTFGRFGKFAI